MVIVMFALSHSVNVMFAKNEKYQNIYPENEGQGQGVEKLYIRHSTRNIRVHVGDFFQSLS